MGINKNIRGTCHQYQHKHGWLMLIGMCTTTSEARIWCQFWNNKSKSQIGERSILLPPISNISGLTTIHSEKTQDGYLISLLSLGKILFQTHQLCSQVQLRSLFHSITNSQRYDDTSQAVGEDSLPQLRFSSKHSPGQTRKKWTNKDAFHVWRFRECEKQSMGILFKQRKTNSSSHLGDVIKISYVDTCPPIGTNISFCQGLLSR